MTAIRVHIKRLDPDLPPPSYAHPGDAGLDLYSRIDFTLKPGERAAIPTGISIAIPQGFAGFVQPRSGAALRSGLSLVNTPGLVDSGYRGEVQVIAINLDASDPIVISRGDKIAQMVIMPVATASLIETDELDESSRGDRGFGSTGR